MKIRYLFIGTAIAMMAVSTPQPSTAFTKAEALACVNKGVGLFLAGGDVASIIDIDFMIDREKLTADPTTIAGAINAKARENRNQYQNVSAIVTGTGFKLDKSGQFYKVNGTVKAEIKNIDGKWEEHPYTYTIWMRKDQPCLIGVLSIEEIFRLGSWVKENT